MKLALKLKKRVLEKGYECFIDSPTNQQFFVFPNVVIHQLKPHCSFEYWGAPGEYESKVRFVVGWSTKEEDIDAFLELLPFNTMKE